MKFSGFDWDEGNQAKCQKHGLSIAIIESLFLQGLTILPARSDQETRLKAIGRTKDERYVFVVFALRSSGNDVLIRPISARYMHAKEVKTYEKENPSLQKRP